MAESAGHLPDWRAAAAYAPLLSADRSLFAWEWLRRDPGYRVAAERTLRADSSRHATEPREVPERWGLHAFEPPQVTVPLARPVWRAEVHPYVLGVEASPAGGDEAFDLKRLGAIPMMVRAADGCEHLLIADGFRTIRLDVVTGTIGSRPVELGYRVTGLASAERPVLTLRRFLALWRTGRFSNSLHPHEARARRWILMLRAYDALTGGADQRDIASVLLSQDAREPRWRTSTPSIRSQAQRLVRGARRMVSGDYLKLLQ